MPLSVGQIINNRYRVVRLLGQGGFGAVYRAWDLSLNIPVALKENTETSSDAARQFAREANILASLRHPNLPKVTDYFVLPDLGQYLVMEYIEGDDLIQKLEEKGEPLPAAVVLDWADQILGALQYLHNQNPPIIHRDIKPQNIRVTPDGQAMLVDFGIAKLVDSTKKTTVGARAVTPGYSPHEQYGQGATDQRTDIYALGATLYTLLTAQVPPESIARFSDDLLVSPREYNPSLPDHVVQALLRALEMDPRKRWQTAGEFRQALKSPTLVQEAARAPMAVQRQTTSSTVVVSTGAPAMPSSPVVAGKSKTPLLAVGAGLLLLLALLGVGALVIWQGFGGGEETTPTHAVAVVPTTLPSTATSSAAKVVIPTGPIKVGLLAPLSGQVPSFGVSTREGVQLAVDEWNARGGVLGRRIELIVADSQCSGDPAAAAANKLIDQDGVKYLIGEVCSSASIQIAEIANRKGIVQISPTSTNVAVTVDSAGRTRPFTFRACFIDPFQGMAMAKFAKGQGYNTAFILYDDGNDYVRGLAEAFERSFLDLGGRVVGKEIYGAGETNFSTLLAQVKNSQAEVLYVPDYYNVVNQVAVQAKQQGLKAVLMGGDGWDSSDLDTRALDGAFYSNHYDPADDRPILASFLTRFGAAYSVDGKPKAPDALATLGYDAANLLFAAIDRAGVDDPVKVAQSLASLSWVGITGNFTFDPQHNPIKNVAIISVRNGGKFFYTSIQP